MANRTVADGGSHAFEVVKATVAPGDEKAYVSLRAALDAGAAEFPGFVGVEAVPPVPGDPTWTVVLAFESNTDLQRWRTSPERAELLGRIHRVADDHDWVLPAGFAQWSSRSGRDPTGAPAWKQAMTALAVLYAMVSVLNITLGNFIGKGLSVEGSQVVPGLGLPFPVVVFVGNAVGTVLLTWVLMPIVTRLLSWWLDPAASTAQTVRGVALLLLIYVTEVLFFDWVFRSFGF
ncbi:MAG: antibiotic biosynthesis monooxygenase [Mycobacterium sp.]|nr:antibiotic biosynthesis monooxygenase [Mycobacterium sp.]